MLDWLREPENRVRASLWGLYVCLVCWPLTHVLIVITAPAELSSWVGHLLLALSWFACVISFLTVVVATDVRREQENG